MKKVILMLFVLGFIGMNGYAQKVYKKDGKVYLECTEANGMPAGSITTTSKCKDGDGAASNTTFRDGSTLTNPYDRENNKVFEKLEIDNADMANPGISATFKMDWKTAYDGCKSKNTGWRLPTQRELMLMYIFRVPLSSMTGNSFVSGVYWSSSEFDDENSYYVPLSTGHTGKTPKTSPNRARCVREVTP